MQSQQIDWKVKQFGSMNLAEQSLSTSNIIREADNVNALYLGCTERAIKALFMLNGGGTVTVLAYLHNAKEISISIFIKVALVIFLLGLILVFNVVARDFYYIQKKSLEFHGDVRNFLFNAFPFSSIRRFQPAPELVDKHAKCTVKLGGISACCVVGGIFFSLLGYFITY